MFDKQFYIMIGIALGIIAGCLFADFSISTICNERGAAHLVSGATQGSLKD